MPRRIEDVPVALLDGERQLLLGPRLELAHLGPLMLGQSGEAFRLPQRAQRQPARRVAAHLRLPLLVGRREDHVVPQHPQRGAVGTLAQIEAPHQVGHLFRRPHGHRVVGQHDEPRPPGARVVRHVEGAAGELDQVERVVPEDLPDAVVQRGAGFARVDVPLFAADDLREVRFRQEAHRRARPVVEIGRLGDELLPRLLDEAQLRRRTQHRPAQLLGRQPLKRFVERQGVHEDGAGHVGGVGRQAAVVLRVDLLRQGRRAGTGHVVGDGRGVAGLLQAGEQLLPDGLAARVDVVQVDGGGVGRARLPEVRDGARQQPEHAAHALEGLQRRRLRRQRPQHLGVQRPARQKARGGLGPARFGADGLALRGPRGLIGGDGAARGVLVDRLEQAAPQHLSGLVLLGRIEQRRLAGRDALGLGHPVGDELVLRRVRVHRPAFLADGQRVDQRRPRRPLHRLEQRRQERRQLLARGPHLLHLAEIDREFVEQDERGPAAEQLAQGVGPRRGPRHVAVLHAVVAGPAGEREGQLAPRRARADAFAHRAPVGRVGVLAVEGGEAHLAPRQKRRVDEVVRPRHRRQPPRDVREGDQAVRLAAAVRRVEAEDGGRLAARAAQAPAHVGQQVPEAASRKGVLEEPDRVDVLGAARARDDLREVGREVGVGHRAAHDVGARAAAVEDGRNAHRSLGIPAARFSAPHAADRSLSQSAARSGTGSGRCRGAGDVVSSLWNRTACPCSFSSRSGSASARRGPGDRAAAAEAERVDRTPSVQPLSPSWR